MSDVVFFFKQKTAYEMRIRDWSSDVCSSDLRLPGQGRLWPRRGEGGGAPARPAGGRADRARDAAAGWRAGTQRGEQLSRPDTASLGRPGGRDPTGGEGPGENGRASCRERVCKYV